MNTMMNSEIFFFISSVGFILLFILLAVLLYYLIKATHSFTSLMGKIEENVDNVGYAGKELIEEMRNSIAFRLLFKKRGK